MTKSTLTKSLLTFPKVTILCSGVALGVYVPALLVDYKLRKLGLDTEVVVLESLFLEDKKSKINDNKLAFHKRFAFALMALNFAKDMVNNIDEEKLDELFFSWSAEKRRYFIVFSGFWMPIIESYRDEFKVDCLNVDMCHMDSCISNSWKNYQSINNQYKDIWFYSFDEKKLIYGLTVGDKPIIDFDARAQRLVTHGGGWSIGTYQNNILELNANGISLDIVVYDVNEAGSLGNNRYFLIEPSWCAWEKNLKNRHEFPKFGQILNLKIINYRNKEEYHELFDIIRESKGIISKPGGATLMDSLASATPIIMLEPYGDYEQKNAELWEYLGFGIRYDKWKAANFSFEILDTLHQNLLKERNNIINYTDDFQKRYLKNEDQI